MAVQTQIQVRRGTASSWTSTNPTLAAGEWGLETDTGKYKVGDGSSVWTGLGYASILPSTVTTKGDLLAATGSGAVSRLAAGSNGYTLVADSSQTTGLNYSPTFFAGKNKIINGDFGIWQRGTSFSTTTYATFYADRWLGGTDGSGVTRTVSQQTLTAGAAPVAGYEGTYNLRIAQTVAGTGAGYNVLDQRIEDCRTLAGQTVTISFWAKASTNTTLGNLGLIQVFGSGGSSDVSTTTSIGTITTSWVRYSYTLTLPSISGKTIGTNSFLLLRFNLPINATFTLDLWGVQLEAGSTATQFQTATGTIQGELAACQRYYERLTADTAYGAFATALATSTTIAAGLTPFKVTKRVTPTAIDTSAVGGFQLDDGANAYTASALVISSAYNSTQWGAVTITTTGMTQYRPCWLVAKNTSTAYIGFSAEL